LNLNGTALKIKEILTMIPYKDEQSIAYINVCQKFDAFRDAFKRTLPYKGGMSWKKVRGTEYLFKTRDRYGNGKTLGVRDPETEKIYESFHRKKNETLEIFKGCRDEIQKYSRIAKAHQIQRVPSIATKILRELDSHNLLGEHIMVVGTHAIYAYEAAAGVRLDPKYTATDDIDFLWDARKKLSLAIKEDGDPKDFMDIIKKADKTFQVYKNQPHRAYNKDGYEVDLIKAMPSRLTIKERTRIGGPDDLEAAEIMNLTWLLSSPKFEQTVIGMDGFPAKTVVPDPRAFCLHKFWTSQQLDRGRTKGAKDRSQAFAVARLVLEHMPHLEFSNEQLRMFPKELVRDFKRAFEQEPENEAFAPRM
jgi:hypothetical protein